MISTEFGDIFYNNCFKNGILPIKVSKEDLDKLMDDAERGANATLSIDLAEAGNPRARTAASSSSRSTRSRSTACSNGLDEIGLTMEKADRIAAFEKEAALERPWV